MARKHEAVNLMKSGLSPSEIAKTMDISVKSIEGYLYNQVGEGNIRRSDIVFSIKEEIRVEIENVIKKNETTYISKIHKILLEQNINCHLDELNIYLKLRDARIALGDLYELLFYIETSLHSKIKEMLIKEFGENNYWESGIPENVSISCEEKFNWEKPANKDYYYYTTLSNLKEILKYNWELFLKYLPDHLKLEKHIIIKKLIKLNKIRNNVMHPVKENTPTEMDFLFVRELNEFLKLHDWKTSN